MTALTPAQQARVEGALAMVENLASAIKAEWPRARYEDLFQAGCEALSRAAARHQEETGVPFEGFAFKRVRGAMLKEAHGATFLSPALRAVAHADDQDEPEPARNTSVLEALDRTPEAARVDLKEHLRTRVASMAAAAALSTPHPEEALIQAGQTRMALDALRDVVAELGDPERTLLRMYYTDLATLDEIAAALPMPRRSVQRLHDHVKQVLKKRLIRRGVGSMEPVR